MIVHFQAKEVYGGREREEGKEQMRRDSEGGKEGPSAMQPDDPDHTDGFLLAQALGHRVYALFQMHVSFSSGLGSNSKRRVECQHTPP